MGRFLFRLPDVGEGVAEAEIVAWHVRAGDTIREDQSLVDVMTDKATVDMTSPVDGVVLAINGDIGDMAAVGSVLVELEVEGATEGAAGAPAQSAAPPEAPPPVPPATPMPRPAAKPSEEPAQSQLKAERVSDAPPLASPAVRRRAFELGVPLQFVPGTGPAGRITPNDLEAFVRRGAAAPDAGLMRRQGVETLKLVGLRRRIAEKMLESKRRIPHFGYVEECDVTELEDLRRLMNSERGADGPKLTFLPFMMRALAAVLPDFPQINARFDDDSGVVEMHAAVHIGIATQTPLGLVVPVVRHAEARDLWDCATELRRVTSAARDGSATREELTGSTITLTSLGALGGISATPVINHPEVAIIGPNKLTPRPVVRDGQITIRQIMNLSSSFDHRIVDGHDAARFIQALKRRLEHPARIFME